MKLKLTLTEAQDVIRRFYSLPSDAVVTITHPRNGPFAPLRKLIEDIDAMAYLSHQKIAAISRYRETVSCGLCEAKMTVENWPTVKAYILKNLHTPTKYQTSPTFQIS